MRLNKYLSQIGFTSRRKADDLIEKGRVRVNGKIIKELGYKLEDLDSTIEVDGVEVSKPSKKKHYYALYKPQNVITTLSDPEKRPCIGDLVSLMDIHVFPVGRLDYDAEGLLLLTNDGELANQLLHPKYHVEKTYRVKIKGQPTPETMTKVKKGLKLEDGFIKPTFVKIEQKLKENTWVSITVTEGKKHLIKRIWLRVGHPVIRLIRTDFGPISLKQMKPGDLRKLSPSEIKQLT